MTPSLASLSMVGVCIAALWKPTLQHPAGMLSYEQLPLGAGPRLTCNPATLYLQGDLSTDGAAGAVLIIRLLVPAIIVGDDVDDRGLRRGGGAGSLQQRQQQQRQRHLQVASTRGLEGSTRCRPAWHLALISS
jgi:hypothetical protein